MDRDPNQLSAIMNVLPEHMHVHQSILRSIY